MHTAIKKRLFKNTEYHQMARLGILKEKHLELINGEIVNMSPIGSRHSSHVKKITALLYMLIGENAIISVQGPIGLDDYSEPEPDIAILKKRTDFYTNNHPTASDVLLLIEVAESSLSYDREVKLPLYATAGVPEVWIVNLQDDVLEIYTQINNNNYTKKIVKQKGCINATSIDISLQVDDLFIES